MDKATIFEKVDFSIRPTWSSFPLYRAREGSTSERVAGWVWLGQPT